MRYLFRAILVVCLATMLHVCVAWASEIWGSGPFSGNYDITPKQRVRWAGEVAGTWPAKPKIQFVYGSPFVTAIDSTAPSPDNKISALGPEYSERACLSGLPFYSMRSRALQIPVGPQLCALEYEGLEYRNSTRLRALWPKNNTGLLSLNPLWPGFIGNTLVYSAPAFLLLPSTWNWLRQRGRRMNGRCPHCNYPIASLAQPDAITRCPECGRESMVRIKPA